MQRNQRLKAISGAIFDLDGTLLDTMTQWNALAVDYLRRQGIAPKDDFFDRLATMSLRESSKFLYEEYGLAVDPCKIVAAMLDRLGALYDEEATPKEGALETLRLLRRNGVKIAVATATTRKFAESGLRRVGALESIDKVFSCKDPEIGVGKSDPKVFDAAREFLGTPLDETIVVEDALYAVQTAKKAGYFVVAIEDNAERTRKKTILELADVYVENHARLVERLTTFFASKK